MAHILYVCWRHTNLAMTSHTSLLTEGCLQLMLAQIRMNSWSIICPQATSTSIIYPQATSFAPRPLNKHHLPPDHINKHHLPPDHINKHHLPPGPATHPPTHLQSTTNTYTTRPSSPIEPCSAQTTNFGFYIPIPGPPSQDSVWSCEFAIPLVQWFVPRAHRPTIGVNACLFCLMMHCKDFIPPPKCWNGRSRQSQSSYCLQLSVNSLSKWQESQFRVWLQI